jgi:ferrochelatase
MTPGILLTNIGSPDAPTAKALRPYLAEFLGDPRIVELPRWLWLPILHGFILATRPRRSARLYQNIWTDSGSPLLAIAKQQAAGLRERLEARTGLPIQVAVGMRYGNPSIASGLRQLWDAGARRILVFPLFPQYSATTTAATFDAVFDALKKWRWMPELRTVSHYCDHPGYVAALANSVREHWGAHGKAERLLLSFHGIPKRYSLAGDPYAGECETTARLVAAQLGLKDGEWQHSFQSRFGPVEWLRPYTDELLAEWGKAGLRSVDAICPGFAADCLETIDEIGREARETFEEAGGGRLSYIPALNARPDHLDALAEVALRQLQGWL